MRRPASAGRRSAGRTLPPHVRFLLAHAGIGIAVGWAFVAAVLALDIAGLRGLILRGTDGPLALALLLFGASITFGSGAMGAAVMALGREAEQSGTPPRLQPAPVAVRARSRAS